MSLPAEKLRSSPTLLFLLLMTLSLIYINPVDCYSHIQRHYHIVQSPPPLWQRHVTLTCPIYHHSHNISIEFTSQSGWPSNKFKAIQDALDPSRFHVDTWNFDLQRGGGPFGCIVSVPGDNHDRNLIRSWSTVFDFTPRSEYTVFVHDPRQTTLVNAELGVKVELECPIRASPYSHGSNPMISWYRTPGYRIVGETGVKLIFDPLTDESDYGTYYCAEEQVIWGRRMLPVYKIVLMSDRHREKSLPAQPVSRSDPNTLHCPGLPSNVRMVTWATGDGQLLIGHYDHELKLDQFPDFAGSDKVRCFFDQQVAASARLNRVKRNTGVKPVISVQGRPDQNQPQVQLICHWSHPLPDGQTVEYEWSRQGNGTTVKGPTVNEVILLDVNPAEAGDLANAVECHASVSETGERLGSSQMQLVPGVIRGSKPIDLDIDPEKFFVYQIGSRAELMCTVERNKSQSDDVKWTFNDGDLPDGHQRVDLLTATMLVIESLKPEHEGTYACHYDDAVVKKAFLLKEPVQLSLSVAPKELRVWTNSNQSIEFHCRLSGRSDGGQLQDWTFIPVGQDQEMALPFESEIDRPPETSETSFMAINNVQKRHEGTYVCRALDLRATGVVHVQIRDLTINPDKIDARAGTTARFLCSLDQHQGVNGGKVYWMRTDKRDLVPGKEEVVGSNGGRALLVVKQVDWQDDNTTYACTDGVNQAHATLFVRDVCAPGERACTSGKCISGGKFCDGTVDCDDGSDEVVTNCHICEPNEFACENFNDKEPSRKCFLQFWRCDGENDCGNNFDEEGCPAPTPNDRCNGTHFTCPTSRKQIPRAFMCDGMSDCEDSNEDEEGCSSPSIVEPYRETHLLGTQDGSLTLTCIVQGKPPPAINWRFNWGKIRDDVLHEINNTVIDCNKVVSELTLINLHPGASGLYTCEAVNRRRSLSPDISVNVAKGGVCQPPFYNDAAWFADTCLPCYCSKVSNKCHSAKGYMRSSVDKIGGFTRDPIDLVEALPNNPNNSILNSWIVTAKDDPISVESTSEGSLFVSSTFGLGGSWVTSYGFDLIVDIHLVGEPKEYKSGPLIMLQSPGQTIYWCPAKNRVPVNIDPNGYSNRFEVRLMERHNWYLDAQCDQSMHSDEGRHQFGLVLANLARVGVRTNYFSQGQVKFELRAISLQYATNANAKGRWVPELEQCECPVGYTGLSCEICATGYERDPSDPVKCRRRCACDECDSEGNCKACPGNRAGPSCLQCKPGFYRPESALLSDDCLPCTDCQASSPHVAKECASSLDQDASYVCRCRDPAQGQLVTTGCDRCSLADKRGLDKPVDAQCDAKPTPLVCNPEGTMVVGNEGEQSCQCKDGYSGDTCNACDAGYFKFDDKCLKCYCSGVTEQCQLAPNYYLWNLTLRDTFGYDLNLWLGRRTPFGGLERMDWSSQNGRIRRDQDRIIIERPLATSGVIHIGIQLDRPKAREMFENDIPVYRYLYGGQMSFRLTPLELEAGKVSQGQANVLVEIESARYGRVWTRAIYNTVTQRYEVQFDEAWWPGGWLFAQPLDGMGPRQSLSREQLLRVLGTATAIDISTSSGDSDSLQGLILDGLAIQLAQPIDDSGKQELANQQGLPRAPVEHCQCPDFLKTTGNRLLSPSCEGCTDESKQTVVKLEQTTTDFTCGGCYGPLCDRCTNGQFDYNFENGTVSDYCQKGLVINPSPITVYVLVDHPIHLVCPVRSHRGGIGRHTWTLPDQVESSEGIQMSRRGLSLDDVGVYQSEALLHIDSAQLSHTGLYTCEASGVGIQVSRPYFVIVLQPRDQDAPIGPSAAPLGPQVVTHEFHPDQTDSSKTTVKLRLADPADMTNYHFVWLTANGSQLVPISLRTINDDLVITLPIPFKEASRKDGAVRGWAVGKTPSWVPYWFALPDAKIIRDGVEKPTVDDLKLPDPIIRLRFADQRVIQISSLDDNKRPIRVKWHRLGELDPVTGLLKQEDDTSLPEAMQQDDNALVVWSASESHEGLYEAVVYDDQDQQLLRYNVTLMVDSIGDQLETVYTLQSSEADNSEEAEKEWSRQEEGGDDQSTGQWSTFVKGFTPSEERCEKPTWYLVDYKANRVKDITSRVERISDQEFRVNHPLSSGMFIRFRCQPIPKSNLTGELRFNITSPDPRIEFTPHYDNSNSTFPTKLACEDLNPDRASKVDITSDTMSSEKLDDALVKPQDQGPVVGQRVLLDFTRVGEFNPFTDSGHYTCTAENDAASASKVIALPSDDIPIPTDPDTYQSRVYIYSPDAFVGPEHEDGQVEIKIDGGSRLRIYCLFDARPKTAFSGWQATELNVENKDYSSLVDIGSVASDHNNLILTCAFGDNQSKRVKLTVTSSDEKEIDVKIVSDNLADDQLIGLSGQNMKLKCEYQVSSGDLQVKRIDWIVQYGNGMRRRIEDSRLSHSVNQVSDDSIELVRLGKPRQVKVFCVVRPVQDDDVYYASRLIPLFIYEPKLTARIEPQSKPGFITGFTGKSIEVKCLVEDSRTKLPVDNVDIQWQHRVTSRSQTSLTPPQPTSNDYPWIVLTPSGETLLLAGLRPQSDWRGEVACMAIDQASGIEVNSSWVEVNVIPDDQQDLQLPKLRVKAEPSPEFPFYPSRVECIDENAESDSQLKWSRNGVELTNVETSPNKAVLTWLHDGKEQFNPATDAGEYECTGTNPFASTSTKVFLPQGVMTEDIPIDKAEVRIISDLNEIVEDETGRFIRVISGQRFNLVCLFYGNPPPNGLEWSLTRSVGPQGTTDAGQQLGPTALSRQGLRISRSYQYSTRLGSEFFDGSGRHAGLYECRAVDGDNQTVKTSQIRVEPYLVKVLIDELGPSGRIEFDQGANGTLTCNAYDGYTNEILPQASYKWEFESMTGQSIHSATLFDETDLSVDKKLIFTGIRSEASEVRIRCVALNSTGRYSSADFGISVVRSDEEPKRQVDPKDLDPDGRLVYPGDGSKGVVVKVTGDLNPITGHVSLKEGDNLELTCTAHDAITDAAFESGKFFYTWHVTNPIDGTRLTLGQSRIEQDQAGVGVLKIDQLIISPNLPHPSARLQCFAVRLEDDAAFYGNFTELTVFGKESEIDHQAEVDARVKREKIIVQVDGLDERGYLSLPEGSSATLTCNALESHSQVPISGDLSYSWIITALDGSPIDTSIAVRPGTGRVEMSENKLQLTDIRQTTALQGHCKVIIHQGVTLSQDGGPVDGTYYSPQFRFRIYDRNQPNYQDPSSPNLQVDSSDLNGVVVEVGGLDLNGHLTANPGENGELTCKLLNATTKSEYEPASDQSIVVYGWQFLHLDGSPASSGQIADELVTESNRLTLKGLTSQPTNQRVKVRCLASVVDQSNDGQVVKRFVSPFVVINVPPAGYGEDVIPEFTDVKGDRYIVIVTGLNDNGALELRMGQTKELECVIRDTNTDTLMNGWVAPQRIGWQLPVLSSGTVLRPSELAESVNRQENKLTLTRVRPDLSEGLRGRCWFYDGQAYYSSHYFPILVAQSSGDGMVRVAVQGVSSNGKMVYKCAAYDTASGARLTNVSYDWTFTTKSGGDSVVPGHFFDSVKRHSNELTLVKRNRPIALPGSMTNDPVEGRCSVLVHDQLVSDDKAQPTGRLNVYTSRPFIVINPASLDPNKLIEQPVMKQKDSRVLVEVNVGDLVKVPEGGTATLTCDAKDASTMQSIDGLVYTWEVERRDGSPIDTTSLASQSVQIADQGRQLVLVGIRPSVNGLRGRCVASLPSSEESTIDGLLRPGQSVKSNSFDFVVDRTSESGAAIEDPEFEGVKDYEPEKSKMPDYELDISGLDDSKRIRLIEGKESTLVVKLKDKNTGDLVDISSTPPHRKLGFELRYNDGQPAPLNALSEELAVNHAVGEVKFTNVKPVDPSKPPLQIRFLVDEKPDPPHKVDPETGDQIPVKSTRYVFDYIDVIVVKPGEEVGPDEKGVKKPIIVPTVDGLNDCGNLVVKVDSDATLTCRPSGNPIPLVKLLAASIDQSGNQLTLTGLLDPGQPLAGRCVIMRNGDNCTKFTSPYFGVGTDPGRGCGPSDPVIVPAKPGEPTDPDSSVRLSIVVEGLDEDGEISTIPGNDVQLTCLVYDADTKKPLDDVHIGWDFITNTDEPLNLAQLAMETEMRGGNQLHLNGILRLHHGKGRCLVTLSNQATMASSYFAINVRSPDVTEDPLQPDSVKVEVKGLSHSNQISIQRPGDDAELRCQALNKETGKALEASSAEASDIQHGWELRYLDEDPAATNSLTSAWNTTGDRLFLDEIRTPQSSDTRHVKGRCVVHVKAKLIDPSQPDDLMWTYRSDWFTVEIVKKPTDSVDPKPGSESDGILVKVHGLDDSGHLKVKVKESARVTCEVLDAKTQITLPTLGAHPRYLITYGWEMVDAHGEPIDSAQLADTVASDVEGSLKLIGIRQPLLDNQLPAKLRCVASVGLAPQSPQDKIDPSRLYHSAYFPLMLVDENDRPLTVIEGKDVDIVGDAVFVKIEGVNPDRVVLAPTGSDISLSCVAYDAKTKTQLHGLITAWEFKRTIGSQLNTGLLAKQIKQQEGSLELINVNRLEGFDNGVLGRCVVYRDGQEYKSDYVTFLFGTKPTIPDLEGDGKVIVQVGNTDPKDLVIRIGPDQEAIELPCSAVDASTMQSIDGVEYGWDLEYQISSRSPALDGSLGPLIDTVGESSDGRLSLSVARDEASRLDSGLARLRCRVRSHDGKRYTSPFYRLVPVDANGEPLIVDPIAFPKFWLQVNGLDSSGNVKRSSGSDVSLTCVARSTDNGSVIDNLNFRWQWQLLSGDVVSIDQLVTGHWSSQGNRVELVGLKSTRSPIRGSCQAETLTNTWISSQGFDLVVDGYEEVPGQAGDHKQPDDANYAPPTDNRVTVTIDGLDSDGNLAADIGDNVTLSCKAEGSTDHPATFGKHHWEFVDGSGNRITPDQLAQHTSVNSDGDLVMSGLTAPSTLISGYCAVPATFVQSDADGSDRPLLYLSKPFSVLVPRDQSIDMPDPLGNKVSVIVEGLDEDGVLRTHVGKTTSLKCVAKDTSTGQPVEDPIVVAWKLRDNTGRNVLGSQLAHQVRQESDQLHFQHLRPTGPDIRFGQCVVLVPSNNRRYQSPYFAVEVDRPPLFTNKSADDEIEVVVHGIPDDSVLRANTGDTINLKCVAQNKSSGDPINTPNAIYQFEFADGRSQTVYDGSIADSIEQSPSSEHGISLTLTRVKPDTWHHGQCSVLLVRKDDTSERRYTSPVFYSGVKDADSPDLPAREVKDKDLTIGKVTLDPKVIVSVDAAQPNGSIPLNIGESKDLECYAVSATDGRPIDNITYSWIVTSPDGSPLTVSRLARRIEVKDGGSKLTLADYRSSGQGSRVRCLAISTDDYKTYASPVYTFTTDPASIEKQPDEVADDQKLDLSKLTVEIDGLDPDGTLTLNAEDNATLSCKVVDSSTGESVENGPVIGWTISNGPDNRPIPLTNLANEVEVEDGELKLHSLRPTESEGGSLRGQCHVQLGHEWLTEPPPVSSIKPDQQAGVVHLTSDAFPIHVHPTKAGQQKPRNKDDSPYVKWNPGSDPESAVLVKVAPLDDSRTVKVKIGGSLKLSCEAIDGLTLQRIVSSGQQQSTPVFAWHLRSNEGQLIEYNQLANGQIKSSTDDQSGLGWLELGTIRKSPPAIKDSVWGRCSVRIGEQLYASDYFKIELIGPADDAMRPPAGDLSNKWATDHRVKVKVNGLDQDGNKRIEQGQDAEFSCEASDANTKQPIEARRVNYGWQFIDAKKQMPITPLAESASYQGNELTLKDVKTPLWSELEANQWGWCQVEFMDDDGSSRFYRSEPFQLILTKKRSEYEPTIKHRTDRPELFITVDGLTGDNLVEPTVDDDLTLKCKAIDPRTGLETSQPGLTYGWEWRRLDGDALDLGSLSQGFASSEDGSLKLTSIRSGPLVKGRCFVLARPLASTTDQTGTGVSLSDDYVDRHASDYFFLDVKPDSSSASQKTDELEGGLKDGTDASVKVTVESLVEDQINVEVGQDYNIKTIITSKPDDLEPVSFGYQLTYHSGEAAQDGELANSTEFDSQSGQLKLHQVVGFTKPLKLIVSAVFKNTSEEEGGKSNLVRYSSEPYPIALLPGDNKDIPNWYHQHGPRYDVKNNNFKISVEGLDDNGDAAGIVGEPIDLVCKVHDPFGPVDDLTSASFMWQFVNKQGQPLPLGSNHIQLIVSQGSHLTLTSQSQSTGQEQVRGRCVVNVATPLPSLDLRPDELTSHQYVSPYFVVKFSDEEGGGADGNDSTTTSSPDETGTDETPIDEVTTVKPEEKEPSVHGFHLVVSSNGNRVFEKADNQHIVLARNQRPFDVICKIEYDANFDGDKPKLSWFYKRPEIPGDVPIEAEVFQLDRPTFETLVIDQGKPDEAIAIKSDEYSFRDQTAEFYCRAFLGRSDEPVESQVVFIDTVPEKHIVAVSDETSRARAFAFSGADKSITCYVHDAQTNERVAPHAFSWEARSRGGDNWSSQVDMADSTSGWKSNQLQLQGLKSTPSGGWELRCRALYNDTFDTVSSSFKIDVREKPVIKSIVLEREKPTDLIFTDQDDLPTDTYDATQDYQLNCKPEIAGNTEPFVNWQKCLGDECLQLEHVGSGGGSLIMVANSTRYQHEGLFQCQVTLQLKEFNFKSTETRKIRVNRQAAPDIFGSIAVPFTTADEMNIQCTDQLGSPEAKVKWTFERAEGSPVAPNENPLDVAKFFSDKRVYTLVIPRSEMITAFSGKYTCTAENAIGKSSATIDVTITPRSYRKWLRYRRLLYKRSTGEN